MSMVTATLGCGIKESLQELGDLRPAQCCELPAHTALTIRALRSLSEAASATLLVLMPHQDQGAPENRDVS